MSRLYSTKDVIKRIGISRNTLFLWLKKRKVPEVARDRNGHRIFTEADVKRLLAYKNQLFLPK